MIISSQRKLVSERNEKSIGITVTAHKNNSITHNKYPRKKIGNKIAKYQQLFRQRSGYISDFTLISPEKNLADFRGFNSTNLLSF